MRTAWCAASPDPTLESNDKSTTNGSVHCKFKLSQRFSLGILRQVLFVSVNILSLPCSGVSFVPACLCMQAMILCKAIVKQLPSSEKLGQDLRG